MGSKNFPARNGYWLAACVVCCGIGVGLGVMIGGGREKEETTVSAGSGDRTAARPDWSVAPPTPSPEDARKAAPEEAKPGDAAADGAGQEESVTIPLSLARKLALSPLHDDLLINDDFRTALGLTEEQEREVNSLLASTAAGLRRLETERCVVVSREGATVIVDIPEFPEAVDIHGVFQRRLAEILGAGRAELFETLAQSTIRMSLSGDFGQVARRVEITAGYDHHRVEEKTVSLQPDGTEYTTSSVVRHFREELPETYRHLFEAPPAAPAAAPEQDPAAE